MEEIVNDKSRKDELRFGRNIAVNPDEARRLGLVGRKFRNQLAGVSDFPRRVRVKKRGGEEMETNLVNVYTDDGSQADGTFYFSDKVRGTVRSSSLERDDYLFGGEIEFITFFEF